MKIFNWINKYIVKIAGVSLTLFVAMILFWQFYPYNPVDFQEDHLKSERLEYKAGETVTLTAHFIKYNREAPVFIARWFENSVVVALPAATILASQGENRIKINYKIPDFFETGIYHVCEVAQYRVNPIRTVEYRNCSNDFRIIGE